MIHYLKIAQFLVDFGHSALALYVRLKHKLGNPVFKELPLYVPPKKPRKKQDMTKLSKQQYDYVLLIHKNFVIHNAENPKNRKFTPALVEELNSKFEVDKTISVYTQIWSGATDREKLKDGPPVN
jgi:hypothetical protein